jgi:hypothetical protein
MVYNTQIYWVFGLCPSSGFFLNNNEKHNVSETGSVSVLRWGKTSTLLGPLERANLNCFCPHLRTETDPVSETLCFSLLFRKNPDDGQSPKTQYICVNGLCWWYNAIGDDINTVTCYETIDGSWIGSQIYLWSHLHKKLWKPRAIRGIVCICNFRRLASAAFFQVEQAYIITNVTIAL